MGCVHSRQGQAWQPEHPGETHRRRLPGEKKQKQGGVGRKEERDLGSRRTDANDSGSAATNNNTRKPALNFDSLPPPRLEVQPCTPRAEVKCHIIELCHKSNQIGRDCPKYGGKSKTLTEFKLQELLLSEGFQWHCYGKRVITISALCIVVQ